MKNERKKKREHGRPSKSEPSRVDWDALDALLVHGEKGEDGIILFPSFRALAKRFSISHSSVSRYSKQHNCLHRREQAEKNRKELSDIKLSELRADASSLERDDMLRCIDRFLFKFEQALVEDRVRCDNPTDFNTMVRLRAFILGDADARTELVAGLTLDDLIEAHAEYREELRKSTPEQLGEVVPLSVDETKESSGGETINKEDHEPPQ